MKRLLLVQKCFYFLEGSELAFGGIGEVLGHLPFSRLALNQRAQCLQMARHLGGHVVIAPSPAPIICTAVASESVASIVSELGDLCGLGGNPARPFTAHRLLLGLRQQKEEHGYKGKLESKGNGDQQYPLVR